MACFVQWNIGRNERVLVLSPGLRATLFLLRESLYTFALWPRQHCPKGNEKVYAAPEPTRPGRAAVSHVYGL